METFKTTHEYWHKGIVATINFRIETMGKACQNCRCTSIDVASFQSVPEYQKLIVTYSCPNCRQTEDIEYELIVSNKKQVVFTEPENKLDDLIKNNLTIENF